LRLKLRHISHMRNVRLLLPWEWGRYRDHLLRLDAGDRRLRFGGVIDDAGVVAFVDRLRATSDAVIAAIDADGTVIGAVQVSGTATATAELAFSVEAPHQGVGIGRMLFDRAVLLARNRGLRQVAVHFLADNRGMRRLARRAGMTVLDHSSESEACLDLAPATPQTLWREWTAENAGLERVQGTRNRWEGDSQRA